MVRSTTHKVFRSPAACFSAAATGLTLRDDVRECCRRYAILCYVCLTRSVDCLAGFGSFTLRQVRETSLHVLVAHTNFQTYIHKRGGWYPPLVTITPTGSLCRWHPLIGGVAWFVSVPVSSLLARGTLPLNGTHDLLGRISTLLLSGLVRCRIWFTLLYGIHLLGGVGS